MSNVKFRYLYRDGSNYKNWAEIVFRNPEKLGTGNITEHLEKAFDDHLFIARQIRIPEVFSFPDGEFTSDDHCYHEFYSVEITDEAANDAEGRSIHLLLTQVAEDARDGWRAYDRGTTLSST